MFIALRRNACSQALFLHWRWSFACGIRSARHCRSPESHKQHVRHFAGNYRSCNTAPLRRERRPNQRRCRYCHGFRRRSRHRLLADEHFLRFCKCCRRCLYNAFRLDVHTYAQADRRLSLRRPFNSCPCSICAFLP